MHIVSAMRNLSVAALAAALAACSTTSATNDVSLDPPKDALTQTADGQPEASAMRAPVMVAHEDGTEAPYCPPVSIREGTGTLQKQVGEALDYQAVLVKTTRDCKIVNGKLKIAVGVEGRVMPGRAAKDRTVNLPIRIAVLGQSGVVYSHLGNQPEVIKKGASAKLFRYVDKDVAVDAASTSIVIYAGFDEGPTKPEG
ncbi:hypothetical protein LQ948_05445 [Jiella sp. MQZ9-1]|uniref:Lipoprotein n=1 Tax=Jiella flava TaxID=2816857 RepID=A0A939FXW7_9HYPH|nr:hypothetical protein [Jiella flava]MBO0662023.1 hypothetical protein [Jiella flava]MCD2470650.1 hypothetical protein [Jiella flava]